MFAYTGVCFRSKNIVIPTIPSYLACDHERRLSLVVSHVWLGLRIEEFRDALRETSFTGEMQGSLVGVVHEIRLTVCIQEISEKRRERNEVWGVPIIKESITTLSKIF